MQLSASITAYEVAAFTDNPAAGSPTGVVLGAGELSSDQMQTIATRLNFSHTAFVTELEQGSGTVAIRFFTPVREIENCGHATVAAHILRARQLSIQSDFAVKQNTLSGVQEVAIQQQGGSIEVYLKQNTIGFDEVERETVEELLAILRLSDTALHKQYPVMLVSPGAKRFMLALDSPTTLRSIMPDFAALKAFCKRQDSLGCFAFTLDTLASPVQATARMFAPAIGVDEDIINGNSSGCLGAYLLKLDQAGRFGAALKLNVHQGHRFNRPGTVLVKARWVGDEIETVIGGTAVTVSEKQIQLAG